METNIQTSKSVEPVIKKEVSLRTILNVLGIFIIGGLIFTIVTGPVSLNEKMEFYINEELKMDGKELKEFMPFTFGSAVIYYFLVNIYFIGRLWRKVFFTTLILLTGLSLYMVFYLITNSTPH
ncbi:hypothetical protein [Bacillus sp. V2I10]|uniref:hypothetical protein n=1 Tax=Bacillus sp. V2I10 TaxID=3042276 RepID=UPI0027812A28|nr:hypothetical protein [Bacillus sp. V2I10]MDQ0859719.1 hypothetical protein [Bacillus sp. V2I10]